MLRIKRPFYIIGHNTNTLEETAECLSAGANALEPDVIHADGHFYISHAHPNDYSTVCTIEDYLDQLKAFITKEPVNLALIIFDLKDTNFDLDVLVQKVRTRFSGGPCDGVAMLFTHSDHYEFVSTYRATYDNVGIGVDESNMPPGKLERIFIESGHKNFAYADGITTFLTKPGVFQNICAAKACAYNHEPESFSLVYTWVLELEGSMKKYLNAYVDGIFVDPFSIKQLLNLLHSAPYKHAFELAVNGYNPFTAKPIPKYRLLVSTRDKMFAGTDAHVIFTLTGTDGSKLESLPFNGNLPGALEAGSETEVILEGIDFAEIQSLSIEMISDDLNAGWLPERILVNQRLSGKTWLFEPGHEECWISQKAGPVTLYPTSVVTPTSMDQKTQRR
jgi:PLAT/LH2 domain